MFNPIVSDILIIFLTVMVVAISSLLFIACLWIRSLSKSVELMKNKLYTFNMTIDILQNSINSSQHSTKNSNPIEGIKKPAQTSGAIQKTSPVQRLPQPELFARVMQQAYMNEDTELPEKVSAVNVEVNNGQVIAVDPRKPASFMPVDNGNTKYIVLNNKYLFLNHVKYCGEYFIAHTSIDYVENCYDIKSVINNVSVPVKNQPIEIIMPAEVTKEKDGTYTLKKKGVIYVK